MDLLSIILLNCEPNHSNKQISARETVVRPIPQIPAVRQEQEDHRGWGLFLIKNLMDEVEVIAVPGRNEIRMVAYLGE